MICCLSCGAPQPSRKQPVVPFGEFLSTRGCTNELAFYLRAQEFHKSRELTPEQVEKEALEIFNEFCTPGAPKEITLVLFCGCSLSLPSSRVLAAKTVAIFLHLFFLIILSTLILIAFGLQSSFLFAELKRRVRNKPTTNLFQQAMLEVGFILQPLLMEYIKTTGLPTPPGSDDSSAIGASAATDSSVFYRRLEAFAEVPPTGRSFEASAR